LIQQKVEKKQKKRVEKLEWEWKEIADTECVFKEKRQAFCDAQKDGGDHEEEIDKGDNDKEPQRKLQRVAHSSVCSSLHHNIIFFYLIIISVGVF
jgi:hypothetical protein